MKWKETVLAAVLALYSWGCGNPSERPEPDTEAPAGIEQVIEGKQKNVQPASPDTNAFVRAVKESNDYKELHAVTEFLASSNRLTIGQIPFDLEAVREIDDLVNRGVSNKAEEGAIFKELGEKSIVQVAKSKHKKETIFSWMRGRLEAAREENIFIYKSNSDVYMAFSALDKNSLVRNSLNLVLQGAAQESDRRRVREFFEPRKSMVKSLRDHYQAIASGLVTGVSDLEKDQMRTVFDHSSRHSALSYNPISAITIGGTNYGIVAVMHNHNNGSLESDMDRYMSTKYASIVAVYHPRESVIALRELIHGFPIEETRIPAMKELYTTFAKNPHNDESLGAVKILSNSTTYGTVSRTTKIDTLVDCPEGLHSITFFDGAVRKNIYDLSRSGGKLDFTLEYKPSSVVICSRIGTTTEINLIPGQAKN